MKHGDRSAWNPLGVRASLNVAHRVQSKAIAESLSGLIGRAHNGVDTITGSVGIQLPQLDTKEASF